MAFAVDAGARVSQTGDQTNGIELRACFLKWNGCQASDMNCRDQQKRHDARDEGSGKAGSALRSNLVSRTRNSKKELLAKRNNMWP